MNKILHIKPRFGIVAMSLSLILCFFFQWQYNLPESDAEWQKGIQSRIDQKQKELDNSLVFVLKQLNKSGIEHIWEYGKTFENLHKNQNIHVFITSNDSLVFWSSNLISGAELLNHVSHNRKLIRFNNAWCIEKTADYNGYTIHSFYVIKYVYRINNELINSHFTDLSLPDDTRIIPYQKDDEINIVDDSGSFLFGIQLKLMEHGNIWWRIFAFIMANVFLILFVNVFYLLIASEVNKKKRATLIGAFCTLVSAMLIGAGYFQHPSFLSEMELFSPTVLGMPYVFNSLGMLLYTSLFFITLCFVFFKFSTFRINKWPNFFILLTGVVLLLVFLFISKLFLSAITHSVINFELYKLQEINGYSFLIYPIFFAFFGGWMLLVVWFFQQVDIRRVPHIKSVVGSFALMVFLGCFYWGNYELMYACVSALLILWLSAKLFSNNVFEINYLHFFLFIIIFSNQLVLFVWSHGQKIEHEKQKTTLVNVAEGWFSERDQFAEILLMRMWPKISNDVRLTKLVSSMQPNADSIKSYLEQSHFGGIWRKYDVQVVVCWPNADLYVEQTGESTGCYPYFTDMINELGEQIGETSFYYQNNKNGRISYFGWLKFHDKTPFEVSLFVDIESNPTSKGVGYPELLVDKARGDDFTQTNHYDFARYYDNNLITYTGNYRYNTNANWIPELTSEFLHFKKDGYYHLVYKVANNDYVLLSSKIRPWYDYLLFLTYIFLYVFFVVFLTISLYIIIYRKKFLTRTFASRVRFVMLGTLLLAFVMVSIASIFFNVRQVKQKQYATITDKSRSVMMFLDQFIGEVQALNDVEPYYLVDLLQNLSNGLYLDVNLYSPNGQLVSSSRPLIFDYNIIGRRMASNAFNALHNENSNMLIVEEGLGSFRYLSAYFMIYNAKNNLLGYVNLPFFISGDELATETSTFIVVMINIFLVFALAALFFTIVLIRNLTRPLRMIQDKLAGLKLMATNEVIEYDYDDEIGDLVKQYNRMVDELKNSAEELSINQRKLAWREMAKQIAHEIKNPLTPMKLNLQQLQRAKLLGRGDFDLIFERTARTMIEQIDNLSRIASEFSAFAKMPEAQPVKVDVIKKLEGVLSLFRQSTSVEIVFKGEMNREIFVFADGEQLVQLFNNLIKNAIQAISIPKNGIIEVNAIESEAFVTVYIKDNGKGVDKELLDKLFQPSFTTKTSGMGLGLAIAKNIVVNAGGQIWFETQLGKGTTFIVKLPLYT